MPVTAQELRERNNADLITRAAAKGITVDSLLDDLNRERKAKITRTQKIKGVPNELKRRLKTVCTTGFIEKHKTRDGIEKDYTEGESLVQWEEVNWDIRQKARIDAQKLLGLYPAEEHNVNHTGIREVLDALDGRSLGLPSQRKPDEAGS